ncbi:MAG TPA: hypothetical protein VFH58_13135 [Acidimicrobiales bacterium]|nr:hypothetical protein [Acidimicrobiales bacterium]
MPKPAQGDKPMNYREGSQHRIFRMVRSTSTLVIIALALGTALAAALGSVVWLIATALHHASTG